MNTQIVNPSYPRESIARSDQTRAENIGHYSPQEWHLGILGSVYNVAQPPLRLNALDNNLNKAPGVYGGLNFNKKILGDSYKYSGKYDENSDKTRLFQSAHLPYYMPDISQYPKFQYQQSWSGYRRGFSTLDLYDQQQLKNLSEVNKSKNTVYAQKYRV